MGLMDFLRKKSDAGMGLESTSMDSDPLTTSSPMNSSFNMNSGMEFQNENNGLNPSINMSGMSGSAFGQPMQQQMAPTPDLNKDIQMITLKLDAIKSELDSMSQRLRNLEAIAEREQVKMNKKWY